MAKILWSLNLHLPIQTILSWIPACGEVYLKQLNVTSFPMYQFVSDLRVVGSF